MSCLYITENGSKVAVKGGHFIVECQDFIHYICIMDF